jgi:hypothetical protein
MVSFAAVWLFQERMVDLSLPGYQWYQVLGEIQMGVVRLGDDDVDTLLPFVAYSMKFIPFSD